MRPRSDVQEFFDSARSEGANDETLVALLRGRGWPEEDACRALADAYEFRGGLPVPPFRRSASARDSFLYLLSFATLAVWPIGLGRTVFALIDRNIIDPLSPNMDYSGSYYQMAESLASVIVAFPVYLLTMRFITRELEIDHDKLESGVRRWLTYIALLSAAAIVVGDLITFLTYLLRGEVTARFTGKVIAALVIAGGVFWYYLGSLARRASVGKTENE